MKALSLVKLTLAFPLMSSNACTANVQDPRSAEVRPDPEGSRRSGENTAPREQPPLLTLVHYWTRGRLTVVTVRTREYGYLLSSRHFECQTGVSVVVTRAAQRAELERTLALLEPKSLSEMDPCAHSLCDGTAWAVRAEVNGELVERVRQFGLHESAQCLEFQRAAEALMALAGLRCAGTACVREDRGLRSQARCP
jgi:hypothetical protein